MKHSTGSMQVTTCIFQTSDGQWHLQIYSQSVDGSEHVLRLWTVDKLIEALNVASMLQIHVDNIDDLPLSQYGLKVA